jgi:excisionase family DNA binding protein
MGITLDVTNITRRCPMGTVRPEVTGRSPERLTMTVPEAGRALGLGRNAAYEAARAGEIPTVRFGKLLRVPIRALERLLDNVGTTAA